MPVFSIGDYVYFEIKEHRTDGQQVFKKAYGTITEAFNAWSPKTGDRWQYRIKTKTSTIVFHEGFDEGTIVLVGTGNS